MFWDQKALLLGFPIHIIQLCPATSSAHRSARVLPSLSFSARITERPLHQFHKLPHPLPVLALLRPQNPPHRNLVRRLLLPWAPRPLHPSASSSASTSPPPAARPPAATSSCILVLLRDTLLLLGPLVRVGLERGGVDGVELGAECGVFVEEGLEGRVAQEALERVAGRFGRGCR